MKKPKYAATETSRRRRRSSDPLPRKRDRRKSGSGARERVLQQQPRTGSRVESPTPPPAPRKRRDPLERMVQTPYGLNQRTTATDAGVPGDSLLNLQRLQQQIDENASLHIGRFEGPGTCPHCRQTVHRPWHIQLGNPPIDLYFCNAALTELKLLLARIPDPRKQ